MRGLCSVLVSLVLFSTELPAQTLELRPNDHIAIVGNTLADRMQHHGGLETRIHSRFPNHKLVVRNLGFSADELTIRLRSQSFGTPDEWLSKVKADVVFAMFGYNESFAGEAGLPKFKSDLDSFLKHTLSQKYNGKTAPRVVLFSPLAHEDLKDRFLPSGAENNARLQLYTAAMAEVAKENNVPFVDLFAPSLAAYQTSNKPLTINGIHLSRHGDSMLADAMEDALFPNGPKFKRDAALLEKLNAAVNDKNAMWFERYRVTDGFSIYGGRADEPRSGQSNRANMARELEVLEVLTDNRDARIWAIAAGGDLKIDDSNTPPFIEVKTNKPGPNPDGTFRFLSGEDAISKMTVAKGLKVNLFASEEKFPELISPVQMAFDTKGRLWVATWRSYPHWKPKDVMDDRLLILEDTDGDGVADKSTTFAGDLQNPTGFEFWGGGVLVAQAPDLLFLKDTDGDDKYDIKERVIHGLDSADTHHTANSFTLDPSGALYFQEGTFHHTQVESPWGAARRVANGAVFRYEPRTQKFDIYVSHGFANPHGHVFDRWGQDIVVDGTGAVPYHGTLFSGHVEYPHKHQHPPTVYNQRTRPCSGLEILTSQHFPEEYQGNLLVPNVIGFQGILRYKLKDVDSSIGADELEPIISSSDENFRPTDLEVAPDGSLYFTDWQNPIIGHLQHNLRDPNRNKVHGRVYRITADGKPLNKPAAIAGETVDKLVELLRSPEDRVRSRAKIELSGRPADEVIAAVAKWVGTLDKNDPQYEHRMMEALWVHQQQDVVNTQLLERMLQSPDFRARAASVRVLCNWRDRVSNGLELLKKAAADEQPRVRLEAVRAASFYTVPEAVEIPLIAAELPGDIYLNYLQNETHRTLEPIWKKAVAEGQTIAVTSDAGVRFFLRNMSLEQLLKLDRNRGVNLELLNRPGVRDEIRREALAALAKDANKPELDVLLETIRALDKQESGNDNSVVFDLVRLLTTRGATDLVKARGELEKLATSAKQPIIRQIALVSMIAADGSSDNAWKLANRSTNSLRDFVSAVPLITDPGQRASLYPQLEPLLIDLPTHLRPAGGSGKGTYGRFVRVEIPGNRTLTLAEVEVFSEGQNIARKGTASQKNISSGGEASRGIDGNKHTVYGQGGQTHTAENTKDPWWEVDLGEEYPIDSIAIYNRDDGLHKRLDNFTLKVLDAGRNEVFKQERIPAPHFSATFDIGGGGPAALVRRATMNALVSIRGQETQTFNHLAKFVIEDRDRLAAIRALQRIPATAWPKNQAPALLDALIAMVNKVPSAERTSPATLDALQLADQLTALLPTDQAKKYRGILGELGVRVVRIGTLPERMAYDQEVLVIAAGKPVEIVFENIDLMPHNLVIAQPGALAELGEMAEKTAQDPRSIARQYVPQSDKLLLASRLLQPRETQKISFQAPNKPGVYPFVCTFPGHWRRMNGALYVVENLDDYLADPEGYLTSHKIEAQDELLKDRRPRTEWKLVDLATAAEHLEPGRSFASGKQLFSVASCVGCHKLNGVGNEFGPDLAKLDPKYQSVDILKHVLEPSATIHEKYQTFTFALDSGNVLTGIVLEETPDSVKIIENPLTKAEPVVLKKSEIEERKKSPVSVMPKGLLDKLTKDEILDLLAYLTARGDVKHALFQKGGAAHHHGH